METLIKKKKERKTRLNKREDKPPHDMYHHQTEEVADINKSSKWLWRTGLKTTTEGLFLAAQ